MPPWRPLKRRELIAGLREFGFSGPYSGGKHQFMKRDDVLVTIPNPHRGDIGIDLLGTVLREAGIKRREWQSV